MNPSTSHPCTIYEDKEVSSPGQVHHQILSTPKCSQVDEPKVVDELKPAKKKNNQTLIIAYFFLWFILSTGYNVFNKKAMNAVRLPWIVGTIQMFTGLPLFGSLWLTRVRKVPVLSVRDVTTLLPLGAFHCGVHIFAVLAMSAGSVSFAHIIKSGEPITTSILSGLLLKEVYAWQVYASLVRKCL